VGSATICGSTGATGPASVLPGYWIVDGTTYAQTRAGVQAALDAATAAGGGTVLLTSDIVSDCVPLLLKPNVILNGQIGRRYAIKAPASATACDMISNSGASTGTSTALLVNATRGTMNITVPEPALSEFASSARPMMASISGCSIDGLPGASIISYHKVCDVDVVTSTIILCWPLVYDCRTDLSATITRIRSNMVNSGIKHVTLDVNGNTGATLRLLRLTQQYEFNAEDIVLAGDYSNAGSASWALSFDGFFGGHIKNIRTSDTFKQASNTNVAQFRGLEASTVSNIRFGNSGGVGLNIRNCHNSNFENIYLNRHTGNGLRIDSSAVNNFFGIHSAGHFTGSGSGMVYASIAHQNSVFGLNAVGNAGRHFTTLSKGDNNNVMLGMQSYGSAIDDMNFATGSEGNIVMASRWFKGYPVGSVYKNFVQGVPYNSGLNSFTVTEPDKPTTSDIQFNGAMSFSFHNETNIAMNVRTRLGVLKRVVFDMSAY